MDKSEKSEGFDDFCEQLKQKVPRKSTGERMNESQDVKQPSGGISGGNVADGWYQVWNAALEKMFPPEEYQVTVELLDVTRKPLEVVYDDQPSMYRFLIVSKRSNGQILMMACGGFPGPVQYHKNYTVGHLKIAGAALQQQQMGNERIACLAFLGWEFGCGWIGDKMIDPKAKWDNFDLEQSAQYKLADFVRQLQSAA